MTRWLIAAIIGLMIAALHYGRPFGRSPNGAGGDRGAGSVGFRWSAATLRATAAAIIAAMLLGAPAGPAQLRRPLVALDASASWTRGDPAAVRWARAVQAASGAAAGDSIVLFGDSARAAVPPTRPTDRGSSLAAVLDRVGDERRRLVLVTDGELAAGRQLPAGTRLTVLEPAAATDVAVVGLTAPARAAPGDTVSLSATVRAGNRPVSDATVRIGFAAGAAVVAHTGPIGAFADHEVSVRMIAPRGEREELARAIVTTQGDAEPRNDTLGTIVEITRVPVAVVVSSSPDPDARAALEALAGALSAPPRGFYLVAAGTWRDATSLRPVSTGEVRAAAAAAPLLVLHGDSLVFGAPSLLARSALVLMIPADIADAEWRAAPTERSPLARSLSGIPWDSIPPIEVATTSPLGDWVALEGRSPGLAPRAIVAGGELNGRRRLVVAASGLWRWRARGGPARDAFDALWGAIADWTTSVGVDVRPALPARRWLRDGEPVSWIRTAADSVVTVTLRGTGTPAPDSAGRALTLRFSGDSRTATTPALSPGRYTAVMRGGEASFVVNASAELLPMRAAALTVALGAAPAGVPAPPLRDRWWAYVLAVAGLCGEWIIRRRAGLR